LGDIKTTLLSNIIISNRERQHSYQIWRAFLISTGSTFSRCCCCS